jgi:hypothetical protein
MAFGVLRRSAITALVVQVAADELEIRVRPCLEFVR